MRSIAQPGPPTPERIQWVAARGRAFSFTLEAGLPLLEAARRGFITQGFAGGVLKMEGMTVGQPDGAAFFHCHALWTEADGRASGGHLLPEGTIVAEPFEVDAFGIDGALFAAEPDPETNFKLFGPVASAATGAKTTRRAFALRLRPSQDFAGALEAFCTERGIVHAKRHGSVGSIISARFADGRIVEPFATEMAVRSGVIARGAGGALAAELDVALVDYTG